MHNYKGTENEGLEWNNLQYVDRLQIGNISFKKFPNLFCSMAILLFTPSILILDLPII